MAEFHRDPWAVSVAELAKRLGISRRVVDQAIRQKELVARVYGYGLKRPRILREDAIDWIRNSWEPYNDR